MKDEDLELIKQASEIRGCFSSVDSSPLDLKTEKCETFGCICTDLQYFVGH